MKRYLSLIIISYAILFFNQGCGGSSRTVQRISIDEVTDLSGRWNDTDAKLVSQKMIESLTTKPWVKQFTQKNNKKPVIIVGTIRNLSSEHISTTVFIKDIEEELINNGSVTFVANPEERTEIRNEREDQQSNSSEETAKRLASETGADVMLKGSISTQNDAVEGESVVFYQVDLELINLETNEKIWMGSKQIKKIVKQSSYKW